MIQKSYHITDYTPDKLYGTDLHVMASYNCGWTQFDARFADVMIAMIDEDTDYKMRE